MGELNSDGGYMFEAKLQELLRLATTWGAVVLIDEADIFLEHRKSGPGANAENNALVAVFLRHLEYFSGIIFLTSNRVGVFDTAVTSRIHLALQYSPPSVNTRLSLWSQSLGMLQTEDIDVDVDEVLNAVRLVEMNGREISNTLNTAMTLARHGKEKLRLEHIENVIRVWKDFHENIARMADEERTMPRQDSILASASSFPRE
jgi:AAA+ superfamily predicted ATPase